MCRSCKPVNRCFPYVSNFSEGICCNGKLSMTVRELGSAAAERTIDSGGGKDNWARLRPTLRGTRSSLHRKLFSGREASRRKVEHNRQRQKISTPRLRLAGGTQTTSTVAQREITAPILLSSPSRKASSVKRWISAASTRDWRRAVRTAETQVRGFRLCVRMWISGYRRRIIMAVLVTLPIRRTRPRFRSSTPAFFLRQFVAGPPATRRRPLEPP